MKRDLKSTLKVIKTKYAFRLLQSLTALNRSLTSVQMACDNICQFLPNRNTKSRELQKKIMSWKKNDAKRRMIEEQQRNKIEWNGNFHILKRERLDARFRSIWINERNRLHAILSKRMNKKIIHIDRKFDRESRSRSRNHHTQSHVGGITVCDQTLNEDEYESTPRIYGNVTLTNEEKNILKLPPKFAIYEDVNYDDCMVEIEASLVKLRWNRRKENEKLLERGENQSDENSVDETPENPSEKDLTKSNSIRYGDIAERQWPITINKDGRPQVDMRFMRPTDFPFNKRVYLPEPLSAKEELKIQKVKLDLINETEKFMQEQETRNHKNRTTTHIANLDEKQEVGYRRLLARSRKKEIVIFQTDKSGRFSVDDPQNYEEACQKHHADDIEISEEEHCKYQREINAHSIMWTKILNVSQAYGNNAMHRSKTNLLVENHTVAPLYALRKDHKETDNITKGPPCRPVCGANAAYNMKLSHLISKIIRPIWKEDQHVCCSSEEMLASIKAVNDCKLQEEIFIGSADVNALYPSLDIDHTAEVTAKTFLENDIEIKGVDTEELGLYLALNMSTKELRETNIHAFCPTKKNKKGRPPNMTGSVNKSESEKYIPWERRRSTPNEYETKKMLSIALRIAIKFIMKNHVYTIGDEIKKQTSGGPIGLELTGDLAQIYMMWFDKQLIKRLEQRGLNVVMYQRYVDDINIAITLPDPNVLDHIDCNESDMKTMSIVRDEGNKIHPSITLKVDAPSNHIDRKMPILDLKVWTAKQSTSTDSSDASQIKHSVILHEFYMKNMASKAVINAKSAFPTSLKRTVLTQDLLRIFLRCSTELDWSVSVGHANEYMKRLQFSGYDEDFRTTVVKSALKAYNTILEKDRTGAEPIYRPKAWQRKERHQHHLNKRESWFKPNGEESVLFVTATPDSQLKNRYEKILRKSELNIKVVEKGGRPIIRKFRQTNPLKKDDCKCQICSSTPKSHDTNTPCRLDGVIYNLTCDKCGDKYVGETARNATSRIREHLDGYRRNQKNSVLVRHADEKHPGETPTFTPAVTGRYKDALRRQLAEAVSIRRIGSINNRTDYNATGRRIPTITTTVD